MKGLLFLSRLALICNILFLICLAIRWKGDFLVQQDVKSIVGILGWFLAPFVTLAVNIGAGFYLLKRQKMTVPVWLLIANGCFLVLEGCVYLEIF